jgi:hypothetical protein
VGTGATSLCCVMASELMGRVAELIAEIERYKHLHVRIKAFARGCVAQGDMTPDAERMLLRILEGQP